MSMTPDADYELGSAKQYIQDAIGCISEIVINECSGHADFTTEYRATLRNALASLLEIREELRT